MRALNILTLLAIFLVIFVVARSNHKQSELAKEGAESHQALCVYKADIQARVDEQTAYLQMTPEERIEKYGPSLGTTPIPVVQNFLANQQRTLSSLSALDCS